MSKFVSFCFFISLWSGVFAHKFYTSITDISYNSSSKSYEIIIKLFVDDFDKVLDEKYGNSLQLGTEKEIEDKDNLVEQYLRVNFYLKSGSKEYDYEFLGKEADRDYIWIYIEVPKVKLKNEIMIRNTLLFDVFKDQTNLINFETETGIKSTTLHKDLKEHTFKINN